MTRTSSIRETVRPIEILLVEDNAGDVRLTREALKDGKVLNHLVVASDGESAMSMLRGSDPYTASRRPDVILLDLNLPKKDGFQVLREIKEDPSLKRIPVVVLTTSEAERDVLRTYELHANAYVVKPVDLQQFIAVVQSVEDFWFTVVKLPNTPG